MAAAYAEGMAAEGAHVLDAGQVGHGDALFPRRLARPRRRVDVHRLAQPEGLHRRQARQARRDRTLRRRGHRRRQGARAERHGRGAWWRQRRAGTDLRRLPAAGDGLHRPVHDQAAEGRGRRRQRHGRPDGRPAARAARPRLRHRLLGAEWRVSRPRAESAAAREPRVHHVRGQAPGCRPRDRVGWRRRSLLLHR